MSRGSRMNNRYGYIEDVCRNYVESEDKRSKHTIINPGIIWDENTQSIDNEYFAISTEHPGNDILHWECRKNLICGLRIYNGTELIATKIKAGDSGVLYRNTLNRLRVRSLFFNTDILTIYFRKIGEQNNEKCSRNIKKSRRNIIN